MFNATSAASDMIEGTITRFLLKTETFAVIIIKTPSGYIKALGDFCNISEGEQLLVKGIWQEHPKHGPQLRVHYWEKKIPSTKEAAVDFLSSGLIRGVGPATAKKIVDVLGAEAIEKILNEGPDVLKPVKGIGKKAADIYRSVQETYELNRIISELRPLGLTAKMALKAYEYFGRSVVDYVKGNPYCLTKLNLVGFARADAIAREMGIAPDSELRIQAAGRYVLNEALWNEGHTFLPLKEFIDRTTELLKSKLSVETILKSIKMQDDMALDSEKACLKWALSCEANIAEQVRRLNRKLSDLDPEHQIIEYEKESGILLTHEQREAVKKVINSGLLILTGGPGVGKSQTVRAIVSVYQKLFNTPILLAAPTGRAARRLAELTGHPASTVHRMLGIQRGDGIQFDQYNPLDAGLIVLDEVSMMDIILAAKFFKAVQDNTRVLLVGDPDQLPPVGPGYLLRDLLEAGIPSVKLTKVFRQAQESLIVKNAHRVNRGKMITLVKGKHDFLFFQRETPQEIADCILSCARRISKDVLVLSPMKGGPIGTVELNRRLQEVINPKGKEIKVGQTIFREGDKVIQKRNNYGKMVFNGDIGVITCITGDYVRVRFHDALVDYGPDELKDLDLGYCITIHRSQGSECDTVIVPLTTMHYIMLARNLVYTAITRATRKVILIGTKKALAIAIKNNKMVQRYSTLRERLSAVDSVLR